jgi:RimJ/RimL family protein N-acetyltransferase
MTDNIKGTFNLKAGYDPAAPVRIETPRLILREMQPSDIDALRVLTKKPGFYYYCFDGSEQKLKDFIDLCERTKTPNPKTGLRDMFMMAVLRKDTGEFIGHTNLERITEYKVPVPGIEYETSYFIDNDAQGKGYGPEAIVNIMHYGFSEIGIPALGSVQELDNDKAIKLARDIYGFKKHSELTSTTAHGTKTYQFCTVTADEFAALRRNDKRPYLLPPQGGARPGIDSPRPAP